jgi:hypothetical protein
MYARSHYIRSGGQLRRSFLVAWVLHMWVRLVGLKSWGLPLANIGRAWIDWLQMNSFVSVLQAVYQLKT